MGKNYETTSLDLSQFSVKELATLIQNISLYLYKNLKISKDTSLAQNTSLFLHNDEEDRTSKKEKQEIISLIEKIFFNETDKNYFYHIKLKEAKSIFTTLILFIKKYPDASNAVTQLTLKEWENSVNKLALFYKVPSKASYYYLSSKFEPNAFLEEDVKENVQIMDMALAFHKVEAQKKAYKLISGCLKC